MADNEQIHVRDVPGIARRQHLPRADRGDHPSPRARVGLLRRQLHRLLTPDQVTQIAGDERARPGAARAAASPRSCLPRATLLAPPLTEGEGMVDRRPRPRPHRQTQAHDGFGRTLQPPRALRSSSIRREPQPTVRELSDPFVAEASNPSEPRNKNGPFVAALEGLPAEPSASRHRGARFGAPDLRYALARSERPRLEPEGWGRALGPQSRDPRRSHVDGPDHDPRLGTLAVHRRSLGGRRAGEPLPSRGMGRRASFPRQPRFYSRSTADGVPYWKIATLHAADVLATTVLQTCTRYGNRKTSCQFCAIGQSLAAKSTIAEKTPAAAGGSRRSAAVELDGVRHLVMTTGTPATDDRGARVLADCARAIKTQRPLPVQAQCEPPADFAWFRAAARRGRGRARAAPRSRERAGAAAHHAGQGGGARWPVTSTLSQRAVEIFGRGQVSTYILAGLGDTRGRDRRSVPSGSSRSECTRSWCRSCPSRARRLEHHEPPSPMLMDRRLARVLRASLARGGLTSAEIKAGCARCGACSSLKVREAAEGRPDA